MGRASSAAEVVHSASALTSDLGARLLADAFISYSRLDLAFALRLEEALIAVGQTVWLDKNDIPAAAPWLPEVQSGIDSADNFIFILSPDSVISDPCMQELAHAITNGKRLVPICYRKPDQAAVPVSLAPINYIFFNETVGFDSALKTLVAAMHTDLDWVRSHTRLQVRALEWQAKSSDRSYLLGGSDLQGAEAWLGRAASQPIKPTELQSQYITASRAAATRAQRRNLTIATAVAVVASALAVVAVIQYFKAKRETVLADKATKTAVEQRQEADRQRDIATQQRVEADRQRDAAEHETRIATSGRLAATAIGLKDSQLDVASLLAIEAGRVEPTFDSLNAQVTLFQSSPDLVTYLRQPGAQDSFIDSLAFSPDGKQFATSTDEGVITLWDSQKRRPVATLPRPQDKSDAFQIAFSPDGSTLAVAYDQGAGVQLWNVAGRRPTLVRPGVALQPASPCCVAFHPRGKLIAAGGDGGIQLWVTPQLQPVRSQPVAGRSAPLIRGIAFSPTDPLLLAYTVDGTIHLENPLTGESRGLIKPPFLPESTADTETYGAIAFSPDGTLIAGGPRTGTVALWKLEPKGSTYAGSLRGTLALGDNGIPMGVAFRPDGKELVAISNHGAMRKWDVASLKLLRDYPPTLTLDIHCLAFNRDGSQIFAGLNSGIMLLWSDAGPALSRAAESEFPESDRTSVVIDANTKLLTDAKHWDVASAGAAARLTSTGVEVFDHGRRFMLPGTTNADRQLAISANGRFVAASSGRPVRIWELSQPSKPPNSVPTKDLSFAMALSPSGDRLVSGDFSSLDVWDTATHKLVGQNVEPNRNSVVQLAFSPDGRQIAMGLFEGEVFLLDAATQRVLGEHILASQEDYRRNSSFVSFSKDGGTLFIRKIDGTLLKWDADPKAWGPRACRVAGRNLSMNEWKRYIGDTIPYHRTCPQFPNGEGVPR